MAGWRVGARWPRTVSVGRVTAAVLVVEDDELIASSLVRALRSKGYDASSTATARRSVGSWCVTTPTSP